MKTQRVSFFSGLVLLGLLSTACGAADGGQDPTANAGSDLNGGGGSSGGGSGGGGVVDAGVPVPPPPGPACGGGGFGNANGVCTSDTSMLLEAEAACAKEQALLHSFSPDEKCGRGSSNSASYTCCPLSPPPPPPPPPPVCTKGGMANANGVCTSDTSMEAAASDACQKQGLALTSFAGDEKCGKGSSNSATYSCCPGTLVP